MSILFLDSVDHVRLASTSTQALRKWQTFGVPATVSPDQYEGGTAQQGTSSGVDLWRATPPFGTKNTLFVHFKHRFLNNVNGTAAIQNAGVTFRLGGSDQISFKFRAFDFSSTGEYGVLGEQVEMVVERNGTVISRHGRFNSRSWYAFQIKVEPGVSGSYEIRASKRQGRFKEPMQVVAVATGVNLADTGNDGADQVLFTQQSGGVSLMMDTIVTDDAGAAPFNDFLDEPRLVRAFFPSSTDTVRNEWELKGGSPTKHQALDDPAGSNNLVNDDADRITSDTPGQEQLLGFVDVSRTSSSTIFDAVAIYPEVSMESSGSLTYRVIYENLLATLSEGTDQIVGSTVVEMDRQLWTLNPITSAPWTKADLDDAKFGVKLIS